MDRYLWKDAFLYTCCWMLWLDLAACVFPNICIYSFMRGYNTSARLWEQLRSLTICHSFVFIRDIWARASVPPMGCLVQVVMGAGICRFLCCADLNFFVCVRDGSICGCIVTTTFVHKSRNLWQTRLCIRRSHALTFLLHSNTSIIVVSSQVNSLMQLNYLIQSDTDSEQRNCGNIKSRPCARLPLESHMKSLICWFSDENQVFK